MTVLRRRGSVRHSGVLALLAGLMLWSGTVAAVSDGKEAGTGSRATPDEVVDRTHDYVARTLDAPAQWFDNYFSDERLTEEAQATTIARLRLGVAWDEEDGFELESGFHASIRLPRASKRWRLLITGDTDAGVAEDELDEPPLQQDDDDNKVQLGLLYTVVDQPRSNFNVRLGLKWGWPPEPEARARYRYLRPLTERSLVRFTQDVFWRESEGFGERTRIDTEYSRRPDRLFRWALSGTYGEETDGLEWSSKWSWFRHLSEKHATRFDMGLSGKTDAEDEISQYYTRFRYRRNFHRPWLFYEIQPEVTWPDERDYEANLGLTLLVEVQFGGRHRLLDHLR